MNASYAECKSLPQERSILDIINCEEWASDHFITVYTQGRPPVRMTLGELQGTVRRVASWLMDRGLKSGDRIGILAHNSLEWILLDLACIRQGIVTAGFEPEAFASRVDLTDTYDLQLLVCDRLCAAAVDAGERFVPLQSIPTIGTVEDLAIPLPPPYRFHLDECSTIKFTSGSTGKAKGLGATVGSIDQSIRGVQALFHHGPKDKLFVFLPLSLLQQRYWIYSAIAFGHDIVVTAPSLAFDVLHREAPTVVMGVPAFFTTLKERIEHAVLGAGTQAADLRAVARTILGPNVRYLWTGSAPVHPDVLTFFFDMCGIPLFEGYGMNEICIATKNHPGAYRIGSVGQPLDGVKVMVDSAGIVRVKRRHPVNTRYLYAPQGASEQVFADDGTVVTGDLGYIDPDGFLYITGRVDDVVVLENGRNIYVREIEERIARIAGVAQAIVFGFGRPTLGALVHPLPGAQIDILRLKLQAAASECDAQFGAIVMIDHPFTTDNGLLTSQGKPRRTAILAAYTAVIEAAYGG